MRYQARHIREAGCSNVVNALRYSLEGLGFDPSQERIEIFLIEDLIALSISLTSLLVGYGRLYQTTTIQRLDYAETFVR